MNIILIGPPGAGKGTQAKYIEQSANIPQISTGDILRATINSDSPSSQPLKTILDKGELVPDELMIKIIKERLIEDDCRNGFLLDGFPRTIGQAEALRSANVKIDHIIEISVPDEAIINRITGRRVHLESGRIYHVDNHPPKSPGLDDLTGETLIQRDDDTKETVSKRLKVFHDTTSPLINYYRENIQGSENQPHYTKIDGLQSVEQVKNQIEACLKKASV